MLMSRFAHEMLIISVLRVQLIHCKPFACSNYFMINLYLCAVTSLYEREIESTHGTRMLLITNALAREQKKREIKWKSINFKVDQ